MKWTKEKPTKPGWYWARFRRNTIPWLTKVWMVKKGPDKGMLFTIDLFVDRGLPIPVEAIIWWAGPIPEPKE